MTAARPQKPPLIAASPVELLASYERHLMARRKRPRTIGNYTRPVRQFLAWADANALPPLAQMRRRDVEGWLAALDQRSSHTQHQYAVVLRLFFRWLEEEAEIPSNPMDGIKLPAIDETEKDVVTPEEMRTALAKLEKAKNWRALAIVSLLYDSGLRAGELCAILREDVDFNAGLVRLRGTDTKGRRIRTVPISPAAVRNIDRYLRRRRSESPYLFAGRYGQLNPDGIYDIVRPAFEFTGKVISPHDLRHTAASHMSAEIGSDELQTIMGWRDPAMARHYTRTALAANAIAAHRKASPLERLGR